MHLASGRKKKWTSYSFWMLGSVSAASCHQLCNIHRHALNVQPRSCLLAHKIACLLFADD